MMATLSQLALNDEGFAFDPSNGDSYTLNRTGLLIIRALQEGKTVPQIVRMLVDKFQLTPVEASRDVADFQLRLRTVGLA